MGLPHARLAGSWQSSYARPVPITLTAEVERVTFENEDTSFRVVRVGSVEGLPRHQGALALVGTFPAVGPGTRVRATGQLVNDPKHGEQFRVDTLVPLGPDSLAGIEKYLGSGVIPGIGAGFAKRIVERFGLDTLAILDRDPGKLASVPGLGARRVAEITKSWGAQRAMADVMLLLTTHGASPALANRIVQHYGERAAAVVQRSPYRLAMDVRGVGFKTADRMARSLGISGDHPERAQAGVLHELEELADSGHLLCPRPTLHDSAAEMLQIGVDHVDAAVDALFASGRVVVEADVVYLSRLHQAEVAITEGVARLLGGGTHALSGVALAIARFEAQARVELAPQQRAAVELAARERVVVITGGPGVGKTTIVKAVLSVFEAARLTVALAAPTGRAAKRLAEATGRDASTLHRLLEVDAKSHRFQRNADEPLEADAVIVDEFSMVDAALAAALLEALPSAARLVVVGDQDQLPSVGPGAVLRELIASGVIPTVRLSEVFRQAETSGIVANAHRIFRGEVPIGATDADADFFVVARRDPEEAAKAIEELVTKRIPRRFGLDPVDDVQVLCPMHRGAAGTQALNARLQAALNPSGPALEVRGVPYRVGDKVMQTRNDYDRDVFNGDVGRVTSVDAEHRVLSVQFDGREVRYEDAELDALVLAYATSIHKSQGSEYPAVVVVLLTSHFVMLSRNLLYTAVTRAKRLCVLVADPRAIGIAVGETRREDRMTHLAQRLARALAGC